MSDTQVAVYLMNPATDEIKFGDEIEEGMWVLEEDPRYRRPYGSRGNVQDAVIRAQRFFQVTRLQRGGENVRFVAQWVDNYQEVREDSARRAWIVKRPETAGDPS